MKNVCETCGIQSSTRICRGCGLEIGVLPVLGEMKIDHAAIRSGILSYESAIQLRMVVQSPAALEEHLNFLKSNCPVVANAYSNAAAFPDQNQDRIAVAMLAHFIEQLNQERLNRLKNSPFSLDLGNGR